LTFQSFDFLKNGKREFNKYENNYGAHLLYNDPVKQCFLVDDLVYSSILVKLLIDNPETPSLKEHFKLVYEGFPFVRVYEVL